MSRLTRWVLAALAVEASLLALEAALVSLIGQQPIAAAILTGPTTRVALLGAAAVVARIAGHALFPALVAFACGGLLARAIIERALDRRTPEAAGHPHPRTSARSAADVDARDGERHDGRR